MLKLEEWMDIKDLHRQGYSIRKITEITGHSRNTIRRKLKEKTPQSFTPGSRGSKLDPYKDYITHRFLECGLSGIRLLEEIKPMGYIGSVDVVCRFLQTLRTQSVAALKATVRFETPPGQQGQADWAYCGRFPDNAGNMVPIYAFVFVLGFSRMLFVRFTTSMDVSALIDCHQRAFEYLGGWPREILYDNMKQVKLGPNEWNPLFLDFANHYGFTPKTHRIRRPRTKGKVERMVFYVKDNFLNGRAFDGLADLNSQGLHWLNETANSRIHTTTGCRPFDLLLQEGLADIGSIAAYKVYPMHMVRVSVESFVNIGGSRYSVPPVHVGKSVIVTLREHRVIVRSGDLIASRAGAPSQGVIIAEHDEAEHPGSCIAAKEHLAELWKLSLASPDGPLPSWQMTFRQEVAATPLSIYEASAGCSSPTGYETEVAA
jgi:transposase